MRVELFLREPCCVPHHFHHIDRGVRLGGLGPLIGVSDDDAGPPDCNECSDQLWGTRVSPSTVSDLNKKIYETIETWRNRPIEGEHPYVYLDGMVMKRSWAGEVRNVSSLGRSR
jgi:hypothetical protein